MKIVLAIDGSEFSKVAVEELAKMPLPTNSEVCVINVYEHPPALAPALIPMTSYFDTYYKELITHIQKIAEKIVSDASEVLKKNTSTLKISTSVVSGLPKNEILEKAENFGADLIVVGSQGHGSLSRFLLGSVSQYIATHAKCSVMIARKKDE